MQTWPLESVKRWAATQNIFTIDFGEKTFYSVQTTEGDKIKNMVASYVDLMKKNEAREAEIPQGSEQDIMESDRQMGMKGAQTLVHGKQEVNVLSQLFCLSFKKRFHSNIEDHICIFRQIMKNLFDRPKNLRLSNFNHLKEP